MTAAAVVLAAVAAVIHFVAILMSLRASASRYGVGKTIGWNGEAPELVDLLNAQRKATKVACLGSAVGIGAAALTIIALLA